MNRWIGRLLRGVNISPPETRNSMVVVLEGQGTRAPGVAMRAPQKALWFRILPNLPPSLTVLHPLFGTTYNFEPYHTLQPPTQPTVGFLGWWPVVRSTPNKVVDSGGSLLLGTHIFLHCISLQHPVEYRYTCKYVHFCMYLGLHWHTHASIFLCTPQCQSFPAHSTTPLYSWSTLSGNGLSKVGFYCVVCKVSA